MLLYFVASSEGFPPRADSFLVEEKGAMADLQDYIPARRSRSKAYFS
jgi:hypothetical protein